MNALLEIEACQLSDVNQISIVSIRAYRDFYLHLWNDDGSWYINRSFHPDQIQKEISNPNSKFFLLRSGEEVVGFMKLNINQPLAGYEHLNALELERIYILKSASGKGFGRQALEFSFDFAKQRGKEVLWLKSMDSADAIHFYKKMGLEECGESRLDFELMKPEYRGMKTFMKKIV